jgi:hypothetical protein
MAGILIGVVIVVFIAFRQLQVRPVRTDRGIVIALVVLVIGVYDAGIFLGNHRVSADGIGFLVASLAGAVVFGLLRAFSMRVWNAAGRLVVQGTWLTIVLWVISIGVHFGIGALTSADLGKSNDIVTATFLLYVGLTLGAQRAALAARARDATAFEGEPRSQSSGSRPIA